MIREHTIFDRPRGFPCKPRRRNPDETLLTWDERTHYPPAPDPKAWSKKGKRGGAA